MQKAGAEAQKSGGAAALPAPPPPRSLDNPVFETWVIAYTFDLWVYVWLHFHALSSSQKNTFLYYTYPLP